MRVGKGREFLRRLCGTSLQKLKELSVRDAAPDIEIADEEMKFSFELCSQNLTTQMLLTTFEELLLGTICLTPGIVQI
jgi:hypothetical protein